MREEGQVTETGSDRVNSDRELSELLDVMILRAWEIDESYGALWSSLALVGMEGTGLRAGLVSGTHDALGGANHEGVAVVGAALELLHTAFRIHDDVVDYPGDLAQNAESGVAAHFRSAALAGGVDATKARHWGDSAAILAGDLSLHQAQRILALHDFDTTTMRALLALFDRAVTVAVAGSLVDSTVGTLGRGVDESTAVDVAVHKLAVYTFEIPLCAGAILAGARPDQLEILATVGRNLGIAFQLAGGGASGERRTHSLGTVTGSRALTADIDAIVARHLDAALTAVVDSELPEPLRLYLTGVALRAVRRPA